MNLQNATVGFELDSRIKSLDIDYSALELRALASEYCARDFADREEAARKREWQMIEDMRRRGGCGVLLRGYSRIDAKSASAKRSRAIASGTNET